jgi:hypothetical protein
VPDADFNDGSILGKEAGKPLCSWHGPLQPPPAPEAGLTCSLCAYQLRRLFTDAETVWGLS